MFEWLQAEMDKVRTRKFYIVDGPMDDETRAAVEKAPIPNSASYKNFVIHFGNAKLYRQGDLYLVRVFSCPVKAESSKGEQLLQFGGTDLSRAYFKVSQPGDGVEAPVFEWRHNMHIRRVAASFEEWLQRSCRAARRRYKRAEWNAIEKGPLPFDSREQEIVEARRKFRWRVVGIADNSDLLFEIHNGSTLVLPYLSIGVRGKNGKVHGGVWLPIKNVRPGETRIIQKDCYKEFLSPADVDVFEKPDPGPEDRDRYWEFKQ